MLNEKHDSATAVIDEQKRIITFHAARNDLIRANANHTAQRSFAAAATAILPAAYHLIRNAHCKDAFMNGFDMFYEESKQFEKNSVENHLLLFGLTTQHVCHLDDGTGDEAKKALWMVKDSKRETIWAPDFKHDNASDKLLNWLYVLGSDPKKSLQSTQNIHFKSGLEKAREEKTFAAIARKKPTPGMLYKIIGS